MRTHLNTFRMMGIYFFAKDPLFLLGIAKVVQAETRILKSGKKIRPYCHCTFSWPLRILTTVESVLEVENVQIFHPKTKKLKNHVLGRNILGRFFAGFGTCLGALGGRFLSHV